MSFEIICVHRVKSQGFNAQKCFRFNRVHRTSTITKTTEPLLDVTLSFNWPMFILESPSPPGHHTVDNRALTRWSGVSLQTRSFLAFFSWFSSSSRLQVRNKISLMPRSSFVFQSDAVLLDSLQWMPWASNLSQSSFKMHFFYVCHNLLLYFTAGSISVDRLLGKQYEN